MLQYLGLVLVLISWLSAYIFFKRWYDPELPTISKHVANDRTAYVFFIAVLGLGGIGVYAWIITWFSPKLHLGILFDVLVTLTMIYQVMVAVIPDTKGFKRLLHRGIAYAMAALYIPLAIGILRSGYISGIPRTIGAVLFIAMLIILAQTIILLRLKKRYFIQQALYVLAFQLLIVAVVYVR